MAEQKPSNIEGMSVEYDKENDVKDVRHCDPCKDDGMRIKAAGFCVDCNDHLCIECHQAHKRARSYKNHVLKDTVNIPKSKQRKENNSEMCQEHQNEPINWYCKSHDTCICDMCKHVDHRNCSDVKPIKDVSQDFFFSDKLKQVTDQLAYLQTQFAKNLPRAKENTEAIERQYSIAIQEVIRSISKIRNEDLERLNSLEVTSDTMVKKISSLLDKIKSLKQLGEEGQAFVATRKAESQLQAFGDRLDSVENDNKITKYRYVCEPKSIAGGMIGRMFAWKDGHALNIDHISAITSTDENDCDVIGMEILSDNRLVFADYNNYKITLLDLTNKTVISELKLDWSPFDLAKIDDNKIAITTYNDRKIIFVSISDVLTVQENIDTSEWGDCQCIVYRNNSLLVSYEDPCQIQILNLDGTVKHAIKDKDARGSVRFENVQFLTQGQDANIIYLSDERDDKVSSMTLDGQVISSFTHEDLKQPRGITVGIDGRIFVCSFNTNKIFEISSDLSEGQVILDEQDGITQPWSIKCDECKLYIVSDNRNLTQVFII